jgi:hypothetical protein
MSFCSNKNLYERRTMMRKLLVLMLVLGMASLANAALVLTVPVEVDVADGTYSVILSGTNADKFDGGVYASPFPSAVTAAAGVVTGNLGDLGSTTSFDDGYFIGWEISVGETGQGALVSATWSVEYTGYAVGPLFTSQVIDLYNYGVSYETPVAQATVNFIPEPMTLALLGLGGLGLIRRRRA